MRLVFESPSSSRPRRSSGVRAGPRWFGLILRIDVGENNNDDDSGDNGGD
jgi:hypothetical protein